MGKVLIDGKEWHLVFTRLSVQHAREVTTQEIVTSKYGPAEVAEPGDYVMFTTGIDFQRVVRRFMAERACAAVSFPRDDGMCMLLHADVGNEAWAFEKLAAHLYATQRKVAKTSSWYDSTGFTLAVDFEPLGTEADGSEDSGIV